MNLFRQLKLAVALLLLAATASAQSPSPGETLALAERNAAEGIFRDGLPAGMYAILASDGALLWPGAPAVKGPVAARLLLTAQSGLDSLKLTWQPLGLELAGDGSLGVTWGVAVVVPPERTPRIGRYIAAWRREAEQWKLAAFVPIGLFPASSTTLPPSLAGIRHPGLGPIGPGAAFISADLGFARLAGDSGAALAFERFAAPEAVTFGGGLLVRGPAAIGNSLRGGPPTHWAWHPILAGASTAGDLGFTVGESEIQPQGGAVNYGKYLTIWRRMPDGAVRFLTDGGNARPATP